MSKLSSLYIRPKTKFAMQFVADNIKKMSKNNLITIDDLYTLSEKEVINKIKNCKLDNISENYKIWENVDGVEVTDEKVDDKYFVNVDKVKIRYINPLVNNNGKYERIKDISDNAKADIEKALNYKTKKYIYIDGIKKF